MKIIYQIKYHGLHQIQKKIMILQKLLCCLFGTLIQKNSFNIDLWTKEMTMEEMKFFIFQKSFKNVRFDSEVNRGSKIV